MVTESPHPCPDTNPRACAHTRLIKGKEKLNSGLFSLCRFPLLGFSLIQPLGLFAVYANFLLSQKQIEMSLELMYALTSLTSPFNVFHMCITLVGRQLLCFPGYPMPG